jgi:PPOX class probable F420-dependent enzyme
VARRTYDLTETELDFLRERQLATLTTLRSDGSPHAVAIAFTFDAGSEMVRIITSDGSQKVRNIEQTPRVAVCQVDGARWLTLEGPGAVHRDPVRIAHAVALYEARYRPVRENPRRVVIEIAVDRILGRA